MTDRDSADLRTEVTFRTHQGGRPELRGSPTCRLRPIHTLRNDHLKMGAMPSRDIPSGGEKGRSGVRIYTRTGRHGMIPALIQGRHGVGPYLHTVGRRDPSITLNR